MATNKAKAIANPIVILYPGNKKVEHNADDMIDMTRADGEPAKVPAWRVKDLVYERGFTVGLPEKKKAATK
jgi:hypothetical protein